MSKSKSKAGADFEQSNFEDTVSAALAKRLNGLSPDIYESSNLGVVAIGRLDSHDMRNVSWQEIASEIVRETGVGITCIANCDWTFDDRCDEEATFIAFDVPTVPEDYRDHPYRNLIHAIDPATVPSEAEFEQYKRARTVLHGLVVELRGQMVKLSPVDPAGATAAAERLAKMEKLQDMEADDRKVVEAILALEFDQAILALENADEPVPAGLRP